MNMPVFTAENALSRKSGQYRFVADTKVSGLAMVQPALFHLTDPTQEFEYPPLFCGPCQCHWSPRTEEVSCRRSCLRFIIDPYTGGVGLDIYYRRCSPFIG